MGKKVALELKTRLQAINDEMEFYMELFNIPESKEDEDDESDYLLDTEDVPKKHQMKKKKDTEEDQTHRLEVKKNKISSKHLGRKGKAGTDSNRAERKKLKKEKQLKEKLKTNNMIAIKQEQSSNDHKPLDVKKQKKPEPMFNAESKIVFSKVQLDEADVQKRGIETDTKKLLKKAIDNKKQLAELKQSGDLEKYAEIKKQQAWEKALAKTSGQKVRDDPELLAKKLKRRKKQVKKSKEDWKERQQKVEHQQNQRQKERTANLKERAQKKKTTKLKKMAKKGRIIPGF